MLAALAVVPLVLAAADVSPADDVFVTVRYESADTLQALASQFPHLIVDRKRGTAATDMTREELESLRAAGYTAEIDLEKTAKIAEANAAFASGNAKSIPGYACYRMVEETYATMDSLAQTYPKMAEVIDIGPSFERARDATRGYRMRVLRVGNRSTDDTIADKANMVVLSSIHAREYTPAELMTRFAEWLLQGYGTDPEASWLMDNYKFHLVLQANPDGRKRAEAGVSWRKNTNNTNGTCGNGRFGTDLNRNYPYHWNTVSGGSSGDPCIDTYRGPRAASEAETQNIGRYVAGFRGRGGVYEGGVLPDRREDRIDHAAPDDYRGVFLDIHSYSQLVLWSWGDTPNPAPNMQGLRAFGRRMAWFNGYYPQQSDELYATDGTTDDTFYGLLGAPSYTLELGVAFFESCSTFQSSTLPQNLAALKYIARNLDAPYRFPSGPDTVSVTAPTGAIVAGTPIEITALVDDNRFSTENTTGGLEPTHNVVGATATFDRMPWHAGAVSQPLVASDGAWDELSETVRVTLSTAGLAPGVHTIYVQGVDASGQVGTPNAARVRIVASAADLGGEPGDTGPALLADDFE